MTIKYTTSTTLRRIAGTQVQIESERDGVQRCEWLSIDGVSLGTISTAKWSDLVCIRSKCHDINHTFSAHTFGTKDKAFTAARRWLVERSQAARTT